MHLIMQLLHRHSAFRTALSRYERRSIGRLVSLTQWFTGNFSAAETSVRQCREAFGGNHFTEMQRFRRADRTSPGRPYIIQINYFVFKLKLNSVFSEHFKFQIFFGNSLKNDFLKLPWRTFFTQKFREIKKAPLAYRLLLDAL